MNKLNSVIIAILSTSLVLPLAYTAISEQVFNQANFVLANNTLSSEKIRQLAQSVSVKVFSPNKGGSGVLISKQGKTYTLVTNDHVISSKGTHSIQTFDGKTHTATVISRGDSLAGNDLAVLQFQSEENYQVIPLANNSNLSENQEVFAAGFPYDSKELVISNGKISLLSSQPLVGGYQIGYTNEIRQGMSGGALLNQEGKLIGVNGLLNNAILNEAYFYQDGTRPSAEQLQQLKKFSFAVPIQTLAKVAPNLAIIPPEWRNQQQVEKPSVGNTLVDKVNNIAQQITVRIDSKNNGNGSGVIIAKQGQTYYVATALHVVKNPDSYEIITPDGKRYAVQIVQPQDMKSNGKDAALIKFTSNEKYSVASISKYNNSVLDKTNAKRGKETWVFVSGFPKGYSEKPKLTLGLLSTKEEIFLAVDSNNVVSSIYVKNLLNLGHELRYSNLSLGGISGGPVLNIFGEVIGINLGAETRMLKEISNDNDQNHSEINIGYGFGISSSTILDLAAKAKLNKQLLTVVSPSTKSKTPTIQDSEINSLSKHPLFAIQKPLANANDYDLLKYANELWRIGKFSEAAAILRQIIKSRPNFYQAHFLLGLVLPNEKEKYQEALAAFDKVTNIKPEFYEAWKYKSSVLSNLNRYPEALAAIDKAIEYNDEDFSLHLIKSLILMVSKRYPEALTAIDKGIIQGFDLSYMIRFYALYASKNYQAAVADLNRVIKLNPDNANNYILRGNAYYFLKDNKAALADYNQAIKLEPDNAEGYYSRGKIYKDLKDNKAALADYNQAVKLEPDNASAYS
ncbi:tetratricopeptide repeat-containing serine protease family protein [Nostoc commune]|uniref:tetratricopeptide repeat-containing S1 family peptidase n=1 Tax=Nostoc commune TaxID=1178 RepID=UPI0018C549EB|nr:tetratricopeptide repeat-containing serine protease family protein [Nostoc commune]